MAYCGLTWIMGNTEMGRSYVAKGKVGAWGPNAQDPVQLVGKHMDPRLYTPRRCLLSGKASHEIKE